MTAAPPPSHGDPTRRPPIDAIPDGAPIPVNPSAPLSLPSEDHVVRFGPAPISILLRSFRTVLLATICAIIATVAISVVARYSLSTPLPIAIPPFTTLIISAIASAVILYRVAHEVLVRNARKYTLSSVEARATSGILGQRTTQLRVVDIAQVTTDRSAGERLLGLETVLLSSAGSHRADVAWVNVSQSHQLAPRVRSAIAAARGGGLPTFLEDRPDKEQARPIVIGLVGGIGAGKTAVAKALAQLGCIIIDSDRQAREALDLPAVRDQVVRWWGRNILSQDGKVNRKSVADIIFSDPTQRARLEGLVHPIVKSTRASLVGRAALEGKPGVVIDAPLLFEAGSNTECDAVIFIDAPLQARLARVKERGWDAAELARRERAQLTLEEKRARSDEVIVNDSDLAALNTKVEAVFNKLKSSPLRIT